MPKESEQLRESLKIEADPFVPDGDDLHIGRPLQSAYDDVIRQIGLKAPIVLVTGNPGTGKTLLTDMLAQAFSETELSVRRVDRGDLLHFSLDQWSDLLLVDEADSVPNSILETLSLKGGKHAAKTIIFLGLPSCSGRFIHSNLHPVIVDLAPLSSAETRTYLLERASNANSRTLFTTEALNLIVDRSCGSHRVLLSTASLAFFGAALDRAEQIGLKHVLYALSAQVSPNAAMRDAGLFSLATGRDTKIERRAIDGDFELTPLHSQSITKYRKNLIHRNGNSKIGRGTVLTVIGIVASTAIAGYILSRPEIVTFESDANQNKTLVSSQTNPPPHLDPLGKLPSTGRFDAEKTTKIVPAAESTHFIHAESSDSHAANLSKKRVGKNEDVERTPRRRLTADEKAAVARGMQEMTSGTVGDNPQYSRR
jgi:hypothetical protein